VPTYERTRRFDRDHAALTSEQRRAFRQVVERFVEDIEAGRRFRRGLRVKAIRRAPGVFELTWAADGRATFEYGTPVRAGHVHIVWRRVGAHGVLDDA
jgi:hypothetical protein